MKKQDSDGKQQVEKEERNKQKKILIFFMEYESSLGVSIYRKKEKWKKKEKFD